jgi:type IV fimbrial biogenesis protein FimT
MLVARHPRQRGLSLIELVVTFAVLGLVLAAALPSISSVIRSSKVRNVAESLQGGLQRARNEALRRNQNVTFWLMSADANGNLTTACRPSSVSASWVVSLDDPSGDCAAAASETLAPRIVESQGQGTDGAAVTVAAKRTDGAAATSVTFNGFGRPVGTDHLATIDLEATGDSQARKLRLVVVTGGGSLRMCELGVAADDPRKCP